MNSNTIDVLVVGDVFTDLIFSGASIPEMGTEVFARNFTISPGGAANRAIAATRIGASTSLVSGIGDDRLGKIIFDMLNEEPGLDLGSSKIYKNRINPVSASITDGKDRSFVTYQSNLERPSWSGSGDVATVFLEVREEIPDWAFQLKSQGSLLFGGVGWDPSGKWSDAFYTKIAQFDVLLLNKAEALEYSGNDNLDRALELLSKYVPLVVVTLGECGVIAARQEERIRISALPVIAEDPTGAGDIFSAGLMTAMAWNWDLPQCLRLASVCAAYSVMRSGGAISAPRTKDIAAFLSSYDSLGEEWNSIAEWSRKVANF